MPMCCIPELHAARRSANRGISQRPRKSGTRSICPGRRPAFRDRESRNLMCHAQVPLKTGSRRTLRLESQSVWKQSTKANRSSEPLPGVIHSAGQLETNFQDFLLTSTSARRCLILGHLVAGSVRLGEFERSQITHREAETVKASAGRAPAGQSSTALWRLRYEIYSTIHLLRNWLNINRKVTQNSKRGPEQETPASNQAYHLHTLYSRNASASSVKIGTIQRRLAWPLDQGWHAKIENVSLFSCCLRLVSKISTELSILMWHHSDFVPAEGRLSVPAGVGKNDHVRHRRR